jgi:hypothetical protein
MGETGHDSAGMFHRPRRQRMLERGECAICLVDDVADIEAEIGRDLVVARSRGVQPSGRRSDQFGKPALDVHMDVFERALEVESALADLRQDGVEALGDVLRIAGGDDAVVRQHRGMRLRRGDVLGIHMAIDVDGDVDFLHDGVGALREPPAPHLVAHDLVPCRLPFIAGGAKRRADPARNMLCIAISDTG